MELQEHPPQGTATLGLAAKRPIAVTIVALPALVVGTYLAVDGVVVLVNGGDASRLAAGAFDVALGMLAIVIGLGAFRMRRWAWAAFMTWAVIGFTHQLLRHFFYDNANYLAVALNTVAVLALTPLDVQIAFGNRPPRNVQLDRPTRNPIDSD